MNKILIVIIISLMGLNVYCVTKIFSYRKTNQTLIFENDHTKLLGHLNINVSHLLTPILQDTLTSKSKYLTIFIPENTCYSCLENELITIGKVFSNRIPLIIVSKFSDKKNIQILLGRVNTHNYTLIENENIINNFVDFSVPILCYNEYYFFPMKNNASFSMHFYNEILKKQKEYL